MLFLFAIEKPEMEVADPIRLAAQLSELLRSFRLGHHMVILPRDAATWIRSNLDLDEQDRATCMRLHGLYTQLADLVEQASHYAKVVFDKTRHKKSNTREIFVNISDIDTPYTLDRTVLIVEDLVNDEAIIQHIASYWEKRRRYPGSNFEIVHGGGERFCHTLASKLGDRRIVVAMLDTDRHSPVGSDSGKMRDLATTCNKAIWESVSLLIFDTKEVENIIPISVIKELGCASEKGRTVGFLERLRDCESSEAAAPLFSQYFDMKMGLSPSRYKQMTNTIDRNWVAEKLLLLGCNPEEYEIPGFGAGIVSALLEDKKSLQTFLKKTLDSEWQGKFGAVLMKALWHAVAPQKNHC